MQPFPAGWAQVLTVESAQVDGEAIGLAEPFPTLPANIGLVAGVGAHMAGQLNALGKNSSAVLAGVHLPCKEKQVASLGTWALLAYLRLGWLQSWLCPLGHLPSACFLLAW